MDKTKYCKTTYIKVKIPGKKSVLLEHTRIIYKDGFSFMSGYEINRHAEAKTVYGGLRQHVIQLSDRVKLTHQNPRLLPGAGRRDHSPSLARRSTLLFAKQIFFTNSPIL